MRPCHRSPSRLRVPLLVSACLLGVRCTWKGDDNRSPALFRKRGNFVPVLAVCPECVAGMGVPRLRIWITDGDGAAVLGDRARVVREDGADVTGRLTAACTSLARLAVRCGVRRAVLKERSPSCGVHRVYNGPRLVSGCGVFTAALRRAGILVISDERFCGPGRVSAKKSP